MADTINDEPPPIVHDGDDCIMTDADEEDDEDEYEYEYSEDEDDEEDAPSDSDSTHDSAAVAHKKKKCSSGTEETERTTHHQTSSASSPMLLDTATSKMQRNKRITILDPNQLQSLLDTRLQDACQALGVSAAAAFHLLRTNDWDLQQLLTAYFGDADAVLKAAGVSCRCANTDTAAQQKALAAVQQEDCPICYETLDTSLQMPCGHAFCHDCWYDFLENAIAHEGPSCVLMTCPDAACPERVTEEEVQAVVDVATTNSAAAAASASAAATASASPSATAASPTSATSATTTSPTSTPEQHWIMTKFRKFQLASFVETNPLLRWCPRAGCDRVACAQTRQGVLDDDDVDCRAKMAYCTCTAANNKNSNTTTTLVVDQPFCFGCGEPEPHHPTPCRDLTQWKDKCQNESETANWMTANTKACPKCSARIHKDGGCMYVTCRACHHGFCWMCMGTHHVWQCNAFTEDANVTRAKNELERYLHYYERYHGHDESQAFCRKQLAKMATLEDTVESDREGPVDLEFLVTANVQLLECRRVLKYTYVFAYYRFVNASSDNECKRQKECFEHHQGILEGLTEGLSKAAEVPLAKIDATDVVNRTRVIGQFIRNVLEYVDGGMVME